MGADKLLTHINKTDKHFTNIPNKCPSINEDFCSRSRHAKKITTGICLIFRGLFFEHNAEIGQKDHLWMDTNKRRI
jgi:hypothetical protein